MRNRYPGTCYRCGKRVESGEGHFERYRGKWRTQHADCAIQYRNTDQHYVLTPVKRMKEADANPTKEGTPP